MAKGKAEQIVNAAELVQKGKARGLMETYGILDDLLKKDPLPYDDVEDTLAVIEDEFQQFTESCDDLLEKMLQANKSDVEYSEAEDKMRKTTREVKVLISRVKRTLARNESTPSSSTPSKLKTKKYPKIELPTFSGDVREWLTYWSQFKQTHEDSSISDADKFQYLIQSTVEGSEAREIVTSFPVCGENYKDAVEQLHKMYGNEKMLIKVYIRDLLNLVMSNAKQKETSLSSLYFKLSAKLKALQTLKVTTDKCASVIYPLVESCLPEETLRAWQRHPTCQAVAHGEEELEKLMEFLQKEVNSENNIKMACSGLEDEVPKVQDGKKSKKNVSLTPTAAGLVSISAKSCIFCEASNHNSDVCRKAGKMTLKQKEDIIKNKKACFKCLRCDGKRGHKSSNCKYPVTCLSCGGNHQTILCRTSAANQDRDTKSMKIENDRKEETSGGSNNFVTAMNYVRSPDSILPTIRVKVTGAETTCEARVIFDTASHYSYITKDLAEKMRLQKVGWELQRHGVFGGEVTKEVRHIKYKLKISALDGSNGFCFDVVDTPQIASAVKQIPPGQWIDEMEKMGAFINDKGINASEVQILIGADVIGKMLTGNKFQLKCEPGLIAWQSVYGWTLMGKLSTYALQRNNNSMMVLSMINNHDVSKLWELDILGITDPGEKKTREELEESALEHFRSTVKKNDEGRFEVHLPFVEGHKPLPSNRNIAERRLQSTTATLKRDGTLEKYDELLRLWEQMGMIEEVENENEDVACHYLPHRAVYKPNSETTPIRPVFDASCKSRDQCSLNDCLEKGPNLVELIPALVTRFRMNKIGVVADIRKAFQQISVIPEHRDLQRFLWWRDLSCKDIKIYRHARVVFGVSSSPFILGATLQYLLDEESPTSPKTCETLKKSLYVDNVVASLSSPEEAAKFEEEANHVMRTGKFELRGWEIGPCDDDRNVQLLGFIWNLRNDELACDLNHALKKIEGPVTKRKILSLVHMIFDPIGVTAPFTIIPKLLLQELWSLNIGWDSEVPEETAKQFDTWRKQIPDLAEIKIPRWIKLDTFPKEDWKLFVFVDAAQKKAYAACVYVNVGDEIYLVQARSRVKPLKELTTPRLELMSCLIGTRLAHSVKGYMEVMDIRTKYFTDSSTALYWIQHPKNWGVFVQKRVDEILSLSNPSDWCHVPGGYNPADFPSRGGSVKQIMEKKFWLGPAWLTKEETDWPQSNVNINEHEVAQERKKTVVSVVNIRSFNLPTGWEDQFNIKEYDDMIHHILELKDMECTLENIKQVEMELFIYIQESAFQGPEEEKLKRLPTTKNGDGLIRLKTRLGCGSFEEDFISPVVLPSKHRVVEALIYSEHIKHSHAGVQTLMCILRERFWILKARKTIRNVLRKCEDCQRYAAKNVTVDPGPLPKERMQAEVPFQVTGVDLFGPLYLQDGSKCWVALFTCAVYRAVHLEIVKSLDTPTFRDALRRFISRRGRPAVIFSDNGTNFTGLNNAFKKINWKDVQEQCALERMDWRFNPPTAAWWGGFWERMVGVVKQLLRKVLGKAQLNYVELETILCDVESTVNQRPLTYISEDPLDKQPLTPFLFLTGNRNCEIPEADIVDGKGLNRRWKYLQRLREDLRSRFQKEYLGQLSNLRSKLTTGKAPLEVGERVLIGRDNAKRMDWPVATVESLIKGRDNQVRVVRVKTEDGLTFTRPIQRIYPLEYREEPEAAEDNSSPEGSENTPRLTVTRAGRKIRIPTRLTYVNLCK